jgi:U3 small nucleolar RNA-associated protein 13
MHTYTLSPDFSATPSIALTVEHQRHVKQTAPVIVSAVDQTGTLVATGGSDGIVKVWDIHRGFATHNLRGHGGLVSALSFYIAESAEGIVEMGGKEKKGARKNIMGRFMLATGGEDTSIRVWNLETSTTVATVQKHGSIVRGLDWSTDGKRLLSGGRDGVMCLIDTTTWNSVITYTAEEVEAVGFIAPDMFEREDGKDTTKLVFAAGRQDRIRIWDLNTGEEVTKRENAEEDEEKGITQIMYVSESCDYSANQIINLDTISIFPLWLLYIMITRSNCTISVFPLQLRHLFRRPATSQPTTIKSWTYNSFPQTRS